jgi:hypothetical protein
VAILPFLGALFGVILAVRLTLVFAFPFLVVGFLEPTRAIALAIALTFVATSAAI